MPTVPGGEDDDRSIAAQAFQPKIKSRDVPVARRKLRFPIGQTEGGPDPKFRDLPREILRQTAIAQEPYKEIGETIGPHLGVGWERMLKTGPKSKRIEVRPQEEQPTEFEKSAAKGESKKLIKEYFEEGRPQQVPAWGQANMKGIATKELGLNEQEQNLYDHHLDNLRKGGIKGAAGQTSTLLAMTAEAKGKTYVIPTIWNNQRVSPERAIENAKEKGLDTFPSYDSGQEAESRYIQMHHYIDTDTQ